LIPTFELTHYGIRSGGVSFTEANFLAIPFHDLLASLVPDYSTVVPVEWAASIGLIPLLLAVVAVVRRWREGPVLLLGGLALTAIGVALGRATPIFWLAYHLLPGYVSFRVPPRALLVFTFAAAALAAFGAAELEKQRARGDHPWIVLAVAGALFVAAFPVFWWLQRNGPLPVLSTFLPGHRWILLARWLALIAAAVTLAVVARRWPVVSAGLILLVAGELYLAARPLDALKPLPAGIYSRDPRIDALLPSDSTPFRSLSVAQATSARPSIPQAELGRLGYVDDFRYANSRAARVGDWPNFPMQAGRATLDGYDGGLLPLTSYVRFRGLLVPAGRNLADYPFPYLMAEVPDQRLLGLLGVRYVLHDPAPADAGAPVVEGVSILENPQVVPRAFLVHTVHASAGSDRDLQAIANPDFDLRSEATIAEGVCSGGQPTTGDQVEFLDSSPETLSLRVASASPSLLVVGTVEYPGWQASVDGKSQPVLLADSLIQGVCLPPGRHTVELRFTPSHWTLALALSLASFAALVVFTAWPIRRTSAGRGAISPQPEPIDSRAGPSLL
ncbi:MAG TPA: hypothetical protein VJO72_09080, partial [Candidatus Dormibacteraeota bacterium]|nr:hypothetical protein [Candidatus Dormibacteraeota bacterium]